MSEEDEPQGQGVQCISCTNLVWEGDVHSKCLIHRRCISSSKLTWNPVGCFECRKMGATSVALDSHFAGAICNAIIGWREQNNLPTKDGADIPMPRPPKGERNILTNKKTLMSILDTFTNGIDVPDAHGQDKMTMKNTIQGMHTPHNSSEINEDWIQNILTQYESKKVPETHVKINSFSYCAATKPGESFNAELIKLEVNAILSSGGRPPDEREEKKYNLIVKFLSRDPFSREMVRKVEYHLKEFLMYSEVIPALNKFQATLTDNAFPIHIPEFIYGKCTRKEYVLVIENMKAIGYETNPKEKGLELEQAKLAMEQIARLHGISFAYDQKYDFLSKYPSFALSSKIGALFKPVVYVSVDNTIKFLRTRNDCVDILHKFESGRQYLPQKFEAMWDDQSRHKMLCLTHGDFWNSNLLFLQSKEDNNGIKELKELSIIDWQISQWNSPIMDLHYLLNTSTTAYLRTNHLDELLHCYHSMITKVTVALGVPIPDWSYEEFLVEFNRLALVGLLMGVCLVQGTLSKAGEKINSQEQNDSCSCGFSYCAYCLKASTAKVAVSLAFRPSFNSLIRICIKNLLKPIGRELLSGENLVMNSRLIELIKEGDEKGLLDVLNL